MSNILLIVGKNIRTLRQNLAWTQERLAEKACVSVPFMTQIERGKKQPSLKVVERIAKSLGVPVSRLFDESRAENFTIKYELFRLERRIVENISRSVGDEFEKFLQKDNNF